MTLDEIGLKHKTDKASNCHTYLFFYEENIPQHKVKTMIEIGVKDGASLKMWRDWLPKAQVFGVDINPPLGIKGCIEIQADASKPIPQIEGVKFDLIVDDGSHLCSHQQMTFELLWPQLKKGGLYIMEDLHTSFLEAYDDAEETTFDYLLKRHGKDMKLFRRYRHGWTDSVTCIITKR